MNEQPRKRREWVKNAMIIFLTVMLILTFFSNTIMNYSLPEVATQYIQPGNITAKIRGTGEVESGDPYNVEIRESRLISSVLVRNGDEVEKDQVLCLLADSESEELKMAEKELDSLMLAFEKALLTGEISNSVINNVQGGKEVSLAAYQSKIMAIDKKIKEKENAADSYAAKIKEIQNQLDLLPYGGGDTTGENLNLEAAQKADDAAQAKLKKAQETLAGLKTQKAAAQKIVDGKPTVSGGNATMSDYKAALKKVKSLNAKIAEQNKAVTKAEKAAKATAKTLANAQSALDNKENTGSATQRELEKQLKLNQIEQDKEDTALTKAKDEKAQLLIDISSELDLGGQKADITDKYEQVQKLREEAVGAEVKAPIAGTVMEFSLVAGEKTTPDMPIAVIQPAGKGFTLSFSVTAEQAKKVSVGDPAELQNSWYYNDIEAKVASIKPDPANPGKNKLLTFDVTGDVMAGQSLSLSVGQRSSNYEMTVPNSAVREDNNGKFILYLESKPSPLGNRYIATRADVEVLASDDTQSAISGALYGWEFVITTSTKPVEAGKQVRLAD